MTFIYSSTQWGVHQQRKFMTIKPPLVPTWKKKKEEQSGISIWHGISFNQTLNHSTRHPKTVDSYLPRHRHWGPLSHISVFHWSILNNNSSTLLYLPWTAFTFKTVSSCKCSSTVYEWVFRMGCFQDADIKLECYFINPSERSEEGFY